MVRVEMVMLIVQKAKISLNVLALVGTNSSRDVEERVRVAASMPDANYATERWGVWLSGFPGQLGSGGDKYH